MEDLHKWMIDQIGRHPLFRHLEEEEKVKDVVVPILNDCTEEGQKVTRNGGKKWLAVFQRLENPDET